VNRNDPLRHAKKGTSQAQATATTDWNTKRSDAPLAEEKPVGQRLRTW
jgi:hypothetical protein